jgi:hypothetical protein
MRLRLEALHLVQALEQVEKVSRPFGRLFSIQAALEIVAGTVSHSSAVARERPGFRRIPASD